MPKKSCFIHTTFHCLCLLGSSVGWTATAAAQTQARPQAGQPAAAPQTGGTKVQASQLQQMFQAQSAQNQAQAGGRAAGPAPNGAQATGAPTGQPVMQVQARPANQGLPTGQPGQPSQVGAFGQRGQTVPANQPMQANQPGQANQQGQANQPMQAQSGQVPPNSGQKPVPVQLTPEQAAAIAAAQQQALAGGGVNPVQPFPPLNEQWQAFLDKVLTKWEAESSKVEKFQCEFVRFQYNPTMVNPDHYTYARGELKYLKPDKGLLKVNLLTTYEGKDDKGQPKYGINRLREFGEYWTCDGENVYDMNRNDKICTIHELPPNMRGAGIQASPLPFIFGVKKQDLVARYWIQPLPQPKDRPNEIWLEVYPRRADDAVNYQKLQVVLDLKDWMPMGLIVFLNNWKPEEPHRELYQFEKRVVNATNILPQIFQKEFIPAKPPADWKVIEEKFQDAQAEQPPAEPRVATPPQPTAPVVH